MIKSLLKDSFILSLSSFFSAGVGFFLLPFYTRIFSPSDYGVMDMVAIFIVLVTNISSIQLNQAIFRYYPSSKSHKKKISYFSSALFYYVISYFIVSILLLFFSENLSLLIFDSIDYSNILRIAALNIFITPVYTLISYLYRLNFEAKKFALLSIFNTLLSTLTIVLLILFYQPSIISIFLGQLIINSFFLLYVLIKLFHYIDLSLISFKRIKQMMRFGLPLVPTVLILLTMQYIDRVMITKMIGIEQLGIYAVAIKISSVIGLILTGFQLAWGPYIFSKYNEPYTKDLIAQFFYYITILSLTFIIFLMLFSSDILLLLTSESFYPAYPLIPILALSTLLFFIGSSFAVGFAIVNRNEIQTIIYSLTIIINIFLNYILIKEYNISGAAIATLISFFISGILNLYFSNKYYYVEHNIKKLSLFLVYFLLLTILYYLFVNNNETLYDYMIKISLLISWIFLLFIYEKKSFTTLLKKLQYDA